MKQIFFTFLFVLSLFSFSQQSEIDSIKGVLKTMKDDTNKVILMNSLSFKLAVIGDYIER